jgi:predicted nucleic acid-binding protein
MKILVDTSIWIDYFREGLKSSHLDLFLDENLVVINDLILAELIPAIKHKKQFELVNRLESVEKLFLKVSWDEIIEFQIELLKKGINGVGISDLIIFQNSKDNNCHIYACDQHFDSLCKIFQCEKISE